VGPAERQGRPTGETAVGDLGAAPGAVGEAFLPADSAPRAVPAEPPAPQEEHPAAQPTPPEQIAAPRAPQQPPPPDGDAAPRAGGPDASADAGPPATRAGDPDGTSEAGPLATRADPVAWLIALAAFAAYGTLSVFRYLRLDPGSWDLGIFTEYVKQIAHVRAPVVAIRGTGFNLLGDHFQPIVGLIAPFFRLFPSPVTLLIAQALLTAVSVVPVCRAARELLGTGASRAVGLAYGFSWGLQEMINFDFHEIAFAVPLLAFSLSAFLRRRPVTAAAWALPLVFVKEDQGFTVAALGLLMTVVAVDHARRRWALAGLALVFWGMAWSVLAITIIVPHFNPGHQYPYWADGGVLTPGGHVSPGALARQLASVGHRKIWTTVMVLLPTAFLALRSPLFTVALPAMLLRLVSTNSHFWGVNWHYNATVMPIMFLAAVDGMARLRARSERPGAGARVVPRMGAAVARYAPPAMVVIAVLLAFRFPLDNLWQPQTYAISPHVRAERAAMALVPDGTTAEATLSMLAPLAARDDTFWVGTNGTQAPRFVVFDATNSGYSPPPANVLAFVDQHNNGFAYRQVFQQSGVYVFRRIGRTGG
jgi:uncharacterized membrane protein